MDHLLEFLHSEHYKDLLNVDLQMIKSWMVVAPTSKFYTVTTVLFHKDGGANFAFTNGMLYFYMFVPTKATLKLANGNTGHAQGIGIILCHFPKCSIIYIHLGQFIIFQVTLPTIYHQVPSSVILVLKMIHLNLLKIVILLTLKVVLGDHHTRLTTILTIFISKLSR